MAKCRMENCTITKIHGYGLCDRHYRWIQKGQMTHDLVLLKEHRKIMSYAGMICKIKGCHERPRRNFMCSRHSTMHRFGRLSSDGTPNYKRIVYSKDAICKIPSCGRGMPIVHGFCKRHGASYSRGFIDYQGFDTGKRKKVYRYTDRDTCSVKGCIKRPDSKGMCRNHYCSYRLGSYDVHGKRLTPVKLKNKGKHCSYKECKSPSFCKGYCRLHYSRYINFKKTLDSPFINSGKTCSVAFCKKPAYALGICCMHYARRKFGKPEVREFKNLGKSCANDPQHGPAFSKGICSKCYNKYIRPSRAKKKKTVVKPNQENSDGNAGTVSNQAGNT